MFSCSAITPRIHAMEPGIRGCLTGSVQRSSARLALRPPDVRCDNEQVLYDQGIALPAGDVEGVPAVFVPQRGVSTMAQQLLDDVEVPPGAGHHQGSPEREQATLTPALSK